MDVVRTENVGDESDAVFRVVIVVVLKTLNKSTTPLSCSIAQSTNSSHHRDVRSQSPGQFAAASASALVSQLYKL